MRVLIILLLCWGVVLSNAVVRFPVGYWLRERILHLRMRGKKIGKRESHCGGA